MKLSKLEKAYVTLQARRAYTYGRAGSAELASKLIRMLTEDEKAYLKAEIAKAQVEWIAQHGKKSKTELKNLFDSFWLELQFEGQHYRCHGTLPTVTSRYVNGRHCDHKLVTDFSKDSFRHQGSEFSKAIFLDYVPELDSWQLTVFSYTIQRPIELKSRNWPRKRMEQQFVKLVLESAEARLDNGWNIELPIDMTVEKLQSQKNLVFDSAVALKFVR